MTQAPLRILHVIPHYFPSLDFGGTPVSVRNLASAQRKAGHQVDILTTDILSQDARNHLLYEKHRNGMRIFRLPVLSYTLAYRFRLHLTPQIFAFLWRNRANYDVIHLHEYRTLLNVAVCLMSPFFNAKIVIQPHGLAENFGGRKVIKTCFDWCFSAILGSGVNNVIALTNSEEQYVKTIFPNKLVTRIHNGVEMPPNATKLTKLHFPLPSHYILYVGRLHATKLVDVLIHAYASSRLPQQGVDLIIAGSDDGDFARLHSLAHTQSCSAQIHFIGAVDTQQKYELFRHALLTSYVTYHEAFCLVPLEAASVGCWSLVSPHSGIAEIARDFTFCDLVPENDVHTLQLQLEKLLHHPKQVSLRTREKLLQQLSWQTVAAECEKVYRA